MYTVDAKINGKEIVIVLDPRGYYSVITTGLLEALNCYHDNIKFKKSQIILSGESVNSLGIIKNFEFTLGYNLLNYTMHIIEDELPAIILGGDWCEKFCARINTQQTNMKFVYSRKQIQIPIYLIDEEVTYEVNTITTIENDEKSDDKILDNPFNYSARDEVLINITEENVKMDVSPIYKDILELDIEMFQQHFNQDLPKMPLEEKDDSVRNEKKKMIKLTDDLFQRLPAELITKIYEYLTVGDLKNMMCVNKLLQEYAIQVRVDRFLKISSEPYYSDIGRDYLHSDQMHRYIHLAPELTGEEATQKLKEVPEIFHTTADSNRMFQTTRDWSQGNLSIETIFDRGKKQKRKNKDNTKTKCYICKQKGHSIKDCIFESKFRNHEEYCKNNSIHVWKSWERLKVYYQ